MDLSIRIKKIQQICRDMDEIEQQIFKITTHIGSHASQITEYQQSYKNKTNELLTLIHEFNDIPHDMRSQFQLDNNEFP